MTYREAKGLVASVKVRMQDIKQFHIHLACFLAASVFFLTMNATMGPDGPVAIFPIMIWGAIIYAHARKVFGRKGKKTADWEKELLRELMDGEPLPEDEEKLLPPHAEKDVLRMKKRIENLEAIITSGKWEDIHEEEDVRRNRKKTENLTKELQ